MIEAAGGVCLVKHEVDQIDIERGRVVGVTVRTRQGVRRFRAPVVVSGAGAVTTFERLLPSDAPRPRHWVVGGGLGVGPSTAVTLYLGLRDQPASIGMAASNQWIYTTFDHDAAAADGRALAGGRAVSVFVSFGGAHDREATTPTA